MSELREGDRAPDFELPAGPEETISPADVLADHEYLVLAFFPAAWSPTCGDEISVIEAVIDEIARLGAGVIAVSADNYWSTMAWARELGISFPVASDFEPKGEVARSYGFYHEAGVCQRAQFVIDREMTIRMAHVAPIDRSPGAREILRALEELQPA